MTHCGAAGSLDTKAGCRPRVAGASSPPQRWLWRFFRQTSMRDTVKLYVHWSGSIRFLQGTQQVRGAPDPAAASDMPEPLHGRPMASRQ